MRYRGQRQAGTDPIAAREAERERQAHEAAQATTFAEAAERDIATRKQQWRNDKHRHQWRSTLATYATPFFGHLPVQAINTTLVLSAVEPIWISKRETANRLRGRIEAILDWAKARGLRDGENPARWRGHLKHLLADKTARHSVRRHPAPPFKEVRAFVLGLRNEDGIAARALEFTILTAVRTGETIGARWH